MNETSGRQLFQSIPYSFLRFFKSFPKRTHWCFWARTIVSRIQKSHTCNAVKRKDLQELAVMIIVPLSQPHLFFLQAFYFLCCPMKALKCAYIFLSLWYPKRKSVTLTPKSGRWTSCLPFSTPKSKNGLGFFSFFFPASHLWFIFRSWENITSFFAQLLPNERFPLLEYNTIHSMI